MGAIKVTLVPAGTAMAADRRETAGTRRAGSRSISIAGTRPGRYTGSACSRSFQRQALLRRVARFWDGLAGGPMTSWPAVGRSAADGD